MERENYITIQGWMVKDLGLSGNELLVYALIYGFSQGDGRGFDGSTKYIMEWLNATKRTVITVLASLTSKGHLTKYEDTINGVKFCRYVANFTSGEKISPGGGEKISPNNKDRDIKDNLFLKESVLTNTKEKVSSPRLQQEFEEVWKLYPNKKGKQDAMKAYIKARASGTTKEEILDGLNAYKKMIEAEETEERYILHGSTWFNGHRWEDDNTVKEKKDVFTEWLEWKESGEKDDDEFRI